MRQEEEVKEAVAKIAEKYGRVDVLINNASAIYLHGTEKLEMRRYDMMVNINLRGYFLMTKLCLPLLRRSSNPHVLNISPSIRRVFPEVARFNKNNRLKDNFAYSFSKIGASLVTLGMSAEYEGEGIAFNSLWPRTAIATAAIYNRYPKAFIDLSLKPEIMADAAYVILTSSAKATSGHCFIDTEVLACTGKYDLREYFVDPSKHWTQLL